MSAMQEEQLKNRIAETYFSLFDTTNIIGKIDFCAAQRMPRDAYEMGEDVRPLLWAEAKSGTKADIYDSLVQLVLTIGRARTDFFLADLISTDDNKTIVEKMQVLLDDDRYRMKVVSVIGFGGKDPVVDVTVREVVFLDENDGAAI